MRQGRARSVKDAAGVHCHRVLPVVERSFGRLALRRHAGVVDHHVERAEALDRRGDECLDLLVLRHVAALDQRALGWKVGGDAFELGQVVAGEHDGRASVGEAPGRGLADA